MEMGVICVFGGSIFMYVQMPVPIHSIYTESVDRSHQKCVSYIPGLKRLFKSHRTPDPVFSPFYLVSCK